MALTRPKYSQIYDSDFKNSARVATTASVTLSGGAPSSVDDIALALNDRVLVRAQATVSQNGIYRVSVLGTGSNGTWVRTLDADSSTKLSPGSSLSIEEGTDNGGKLYRMTAPGPITLGSSDIIWTDVSGGGGATTGGTNGQVQFNLTNNLGGATYLYYNTATGQLTSNAGIASTSTTSGTFIVTGGAGISGNLSSAGHGRFSGFFDESTTTAGVFIGNAGSGVPSPRIGFFNANTTQNWQVDNYGGTFRWFTPGVTRMELNSAGDLSIPSTTTSTSTSTGALKVSGGLGIGGKLNVGGDVKIGPSLTVDNGAYGNVVTTQFGSLFAYAYGPNNYSIIQAWSQGTQGMGMNAFGTQLYSSGAITFRTGATVKDKDYPTGGVQTVQIAANGSIINGTGITSTSTATGALIINGGAGISGNVYVGGDIVASGNLTINGTTTNINTTNLVVEDKNIIIADVATPTDTTADGAGITVKGATDKTFNWVDATDAWTSSEDLNLLTGKQYEINGTGVLTATTLGSGVITSNLTTLGNVTSLLAITSVATNFSTGNAVITGGSLNGTTVGATTHTTGRFTTVTATTVNAGTIGNSGATLTGTLSTAAQTSVTSLGTLTGLTLSGIITGKTNTGGAVSNSNDSGALSVRGDAGNAASISFHRPSLYAINMGLDTDNVFKIGGWSATANCFQLTGAGALTLLGGITTSGSIVPSANLTYNLGSTTAWWNTLYGVSTQAKYADLAENYQADAPYEPGTVLVFGGAREVTTTDQGHNTAVAGVVSTNPAHLMNGGLTGDNVVALGLTGRLPCRVQGPVAKGDVLVTSTTPGVAQRIDNAKFLPGCVVGKALESINTNNIQTIEVVVGRF